MSKLIITDYTKFRKGQQGRRGKIDYCPVCGLKGDIKVYNTGEKNPVASAVHKESWGGDIFPHFSVISEHVFRFDPRRQLFYSDYYPGGNNETIR